MTDAGMDEERTRVTREEAAHEPAPTSTPSPNGDAEPKVEATVAAPPAPIVLAGSTPEREPRVVWLTVASRAAAMWSVVGAALALLAQFAFRSNWATKLLKENVLAEDARSTLLKSLVGGAVMGALAALGMTWLLWRRRRPATDVERIAWFAAPLGLLAFLPILLRRKAWDQDLSLLVAIALFALIVEGTLVRSIGGAPERLLRRLGWLRDKAPEWLRRHAPTVVVALACVAFTVVIGRYAIIRHHMFGSSTFDLGISDNLLYNAMLGEFRSPIFTGNRTDGPAFLSNHAQFGVFLLVPFYAIRPSTETLVVIQAGLVGLGALPLYFFARRRLSGWVSACIALVYLAYPALHGAALYEMTYLPVAAVFVLATAWAVDSGRWIPFALFTACALSMREDISIGLAVMGAAFMLSGKRFTMGAVLAAVSAVYFVVVRFYLMDKAGAWMFPSMIYGDLLPAGAKASFSSVLKTLVTNPFFVLKKLLIEEKLVYVMHLLVPLALLPLRRAWLLVSLLPGAVLTLTTTNYSPTVSLGFQYVMHWIPYAFLAVPLALAAIRAEHTAGSVRMGAALVAMLAATTVHTVHYGAVGGDKCRVGFDNPIDFKYDDAKRARYADLVALIRTIPRDASVAATGRVGPHISNRKEAYVTDDLGLQKGEYLIYWKNELNTGNNRRVIVEGLKQKAYGLLEIRGEFALLKMGHDPARNRELTESWNIDLGENP